MAEPSNFFGFLNPLPGVGEFVRWEEGLGEAAGEGAVAAVDRLQRGTKHLVKKGADLGAKEVASAAEPIAKGLFAVGGGFHDMADKVKEAGKKIVIGEMAVVGVSLLGIGAMWWFSRPRARTEPEK